MSVTPGIGGSAYKRHLQRRAQRTLEVAQYDQIASILRYVVVDPGDPAVGIAPTMIASTPALVDLRCSVSEIGDGEASDRQELIAVEHGPLRFSFLDVPATSSPVVAANTLLLSDFILFAGQLYHVRQCGNEAAANQSEISWCVADLWVRIP